ncbi:hypothetical protein, conserved [Eimeria tenella]|uniref:THH1/TOM1/TOM3 domain-containing protein n=1 Tax=Eimeria tenella TaxID=5802 RepID=H9B9X3_EIMTE|nr:hypothetical protein, conserved [Eimeria tenella]AET50783.1 hypothetical protein [Eimeria tenella]CDJ41277.1 hypothetical protein, conserved [Eimeria tenella]|eukprot:XP_013232027.1 hypothetical protein, conserved [Eimeria tenella]
MAIDIAGSPCLFMEGEGLLFVLLGGLTLRQLLKMHSSLKNQPSFPAGDVSGENSPAPLSRISLSGGQTRFSFISLLFASSLCRAVALFGTAFLCRRVQLQTAELLLAPQHKEVPETPQHNAADSGEAPPPAFNFSLDEEWIVYLLDSIPSLIFCSAVSLVILFWARIYYAANLVAYPLFSRMHSVLSVVLFVSYAFCVSVAVLLQAKRAACAFLQGLEALLFGTEAIAFLFYGIKVAKKVSERGKSAPRKSSIVRRVIFLSMVCPVLFGLRSFMAFKGATPPLHPLHTLPEGIASSQLLAGQIYFLTEWVPTLLILFTFWHRKGGSARSQQHRPSTVPAEAEEEMVAGSFDSTIMAPLMQQNVYPFTPSPPHPQAQGDIAHGAAMPSEVYPQFMHPQVPYRDSFSNYGQTTSPSGYYNAQYPQQGQH